MRATVLDLGCAEGLIGKQAIETHGADLVHGVELLPERVEQARRHCAGFFNAEFHAVDLNNTEALADLPLLIRYDVVLLLAILHKLKNPERALRWAAARCGKVLVYRAPRSACAFQDARSGNELVDPSQILQREFELVSQAMGPRNEWTGIWRRRGA